MMQLKIEVSILGSFHINYLRQTQIYPLVLTCIYSPSFSFYEWVYECEI